MKGDEFPTRTRLLSSVLIEGSNIAKRWFRYPKDVRLKLVQILAVDCCLGAVQCMWFH